MKQPLEPRRAARLIAFVIVALAVGACSETQRASPTPDASAPLFEDAPCTGALPEGQRPEHMRCGQVTVPENRATPDGRSLKLAVAVLRATGSDPAPDPIVFLSGGPGVPSLDGDLLSFTAEIAKPLQSRRDIVFFDQRGVGRSEPDLTCPETRPDYVTRLSEQLTVEQVVARVVPPLLACKDRLVGEGEDLSRYRSAISAEDLHDVMTALGYREWNLYGYSYGTRLALTALRDQPDGVRSVVLDSPVPVQFDDAGLARAFQDALSRVFADCAADASCNATYPNSEATFFAAVERLDRAPVTIEITDSSGTQIPAVITGGRFLDALFRSFGIEIIRRVPYYAAAIERGDYTPLRGLAQVALAPPETAYPEAMAASVLCAEEVPVATEDQIAAAQSGVRPAVREGARMVKSLLPSALLETTEDLARARSFCDAWGVGLDGHAEGAPVSSSIPALIVAGRYDPVTPASNGVIIQRTLSSSYLVEFPNTAHFAAITHPACGFVIVVAFLDEPAAKPDSTCIGAIAAPEWFVP